MFDFASVDSLVERFFPNVQHTVFLIVSISDVSGTKMVSINMLEGSLELVSGGTESSLQLSCNIGSRTYYDSQYCPQVTTIQIVLPRCSNLREKYVDNPKKKNMIPRATA